jgi:hypothetical protein
MEKENKTKKTATQAVALVVVLALAFAGLWILSEQLREKDEVKSPGSPIEVSLIIHGDGWTINYHDVPTLNNTVFKILIECSQVYNFSVDYKHWEGYDSIFVNSINGTSNGQDNKWWQYYVNGEYGEIGCDKKEIFEGDLVEWKFEEPGQ